MSQLIKSILIGKNHNAIDIALQRHGYKLIPYLPIFNAVTYPTDATIDSSIFTQISKPEEELAALLVRENEHVTNYRHSNFFGYAYRTLPGKTIEVAGTMINVVAIGWDRIWERVTTDEAVVKAKEFGLTWYWHHARAWSGSTMCIVVPLRSAERKRVYLDLPKVGLEPRLEFTRDGRYSSCLIEGSSPTLLATLMDLQIGQPATF